ncbi:uncharacterized protein E0L32_003702 [Thyridium curvatum]|uniref:Uncharacterized protein n=1 Tax=Thyridium curvatum TaxID=1093900 RepID=A0A507BIE3_9PEZI|nr:uncharacterized protein E0L32_003702 [Thyridium curvatum]TPX16761.1 hypothetical protein E0L32_003702 [Thyridium curvatum]
MFHPRMARRPRTDLCQICELLTVRQPNLARRSLATIVASRPSISVPKRPSKSGPSILTTRYTASAQRRASTGTEVPAGQAKEVPNLAELVASVGRTKQSFLGQDGLPEEEAVLEALRTCAAAAELLMDSTVQPKLSNLEFQSDTAASNLLSLDENGRKIAKSSPSTQQSATPARLKDVIGKVSEAAYAIITHPPVFITPQLLELYVDIQARLVKPGTLPQVFTLYGEKPLPRVSGGTIKYVAQNPNKASNAVPPQVVEKALDAAIEAKDLDAAVGIVETGYASKAFVRAKIVRKALVPVSAFAAAPAAAYVLATNLSQFQDTMDKSTATGIAFAGILAYVGFTATIGVVAVTTANDQMKRVTWAQGTPLRQRWIREDERAALDKIACSFGFSESYKYGEEEGSEFQSLREYILRKGMVLDQIDLMEGMSG